MNKSDQLDHKFEFDQKFDQKFDHFDSCASESDVKDSKELDVESDNNDVNSASTRSEDFDEYKSFDKTDKFNFSYARNENSAVDRSYENVGGYYFNSVYPEYLVPRTFCKENSDDVPCDLSNWHRGLKIDENVSNEPNTSTVDDKTKDNDQTDPNVDQSGQPINFAYYHF